MAAFEQAGSEGIGADVCDDTDALRPRLAKELKASGLNASRVDEFMDLLQQCNVHTRGALRLFSPQCSILVNTMFDMDTPLGPLQAQGFVASLRASVQCTNIHALLHTSHLALSK